MTTMLEEIKQRDVSIPQVWFDIYDRVLNLDATPDEKVPNPDDAHTALALGDRRWLLARVEELEKADIMRVLYELQEYAPKGCGRCGTPSAACDGDCVTAAYISLDIETIRKALASLTEPVSSQEEQS